MRKPVWVTEKINYVAKVIFCERWAMSVNSKHWDRLPNWRKLTDWSAARLVVNAVEEFDNG